MYIISIPFPHVHRSRILAKKTIRFIYSSFSILVKALVKGTSSFSKENKELQLIPEVIKGVAIYVYREKND